LPFTLELVKKCFDGDGLSLSIKSQLLFSAFQAAEKGQMVSQKPKKLPSRPKQAAEKHDNKSVL
jgi:hypothetical protein